MNAKPRKLSAKQVLAAAKRSMFGDSYEGFCVSCGAHVESGIEPDARELKCENCGERKFYGAEELMLMRF